MCQSEVSSYKFNIFFPINDQLGPRADNTTQPPFRFTAATHRPTCQLCLIPAMQQPIQHVCVNAIMIVAQFLAKSAPASQHCACAQQLPTIWQDTGGVEGACAARSFHSQSMRDQYLAMHVSLILRPLPKNNLQASTTILKYCIESNRAP